MVMFGGGCWKGGMKIFKNIVKSLKGRQAQIIMINGRNEKDFKKIEKMTFPEGIKVVNVGFTSEVPLYLASADVIVNKFGGSSATEMINIGRPMLITEKIPTQEKYNLTYMKAKGVAMSFKNRKELKKNINLLAVDASLRKDMEDKMIWLKKNAISDLAYLMLSLPKADYSGLLRECISIMGSNLKNTSYEDKTCEDIRDIVKLRVKQQNKQVKRLKHSQKTENEYKYENT